MGGKPLRLAFGAREGVVVVDASILQFEGGGCQQKEHPLCLVFQAREGVVVVYQQKEPLHKEGESFSIKSFEFKYGKQKKNYPSHF